MTDEPTIESLQADLIALKETTEALKAQAAADAESRAKLEADLKAARDLNAKLISREGISQGEPEPEDPYAGLTYEEQLEKILPEVVDRVAQSMIANKEA